MPQFFGNAADNLLSIGSNADDQLSGLTGNDTLVAGGGNDQYLGGGEGADSLRGGDGGDRAAGADDPGGRRSLRNGSLMIWNPKGAATPLLQVTDNCLGQARFCSLVASTTIIASSSDGMDWQSMAPCGTSQVDRARMRLFFASALIILACYGAVQPAVGQTVITGEQTAGVSLSPPAGTLEVTPTGILNVGGATAMRGTGDDHTVTNSGTITGTPAVSIGGGSVTNAATGVITGTTNITRDGVSANGPGSTLSINNSGTITESKLS